MPFKKPSTNSSSKGSSLSLGGSNTENSGKSMHAIAKSITETDSRIEAYATGSSLDDPFALGSHRDQHAGHRVWHLNNKIFDVDDKFKPAPNPAPNQKQK